MNKFLLTALMLTAGFTSWAGDKVFTEDFEGMTTDNFGNWKVEVSGNSPKAEWSLTGEGSALAGKKSGSVGGTDFDGTTKGEAALISEDIALAAGKEYKLDFIWNASKAAMIDKQCCDFKVRVRVAGSDTWTTILDVADETSVEASGISYPWGQWSNNESAVDLSDYAGKTINIAFVWEKLEYESGYSNYVRIDEISIEEYNRITGPIIDCATTRYAFPSTWVGGTSNSEAITIKNVGIGTMTIKDVSGLDGTDFKALINKDAIALAKNESASFNVRYTPTLTGSPNATMTIEINDGDPISIALSGTKKIMPAGYSYEGFEGASFPPVGWSKVGNWRSLNSSFAGDWCAYVNLSQEADSHDLISPRLDLSGDQNYTLSFDYLDQWDQTQDDSYEPENYLSVYLSTDGGQTWSDTALFTNETYNEYKSVTVDLGSQLGDNCYVKWSYYIPDFDATTYDYEYTTFFLDAVVLPPLYGAGAAPAATTPVNPADQAVDVTNNSLVLSWKEAQFADSYKVSLGSSADNFDLLNAQSVSGTSLSAPRLEYNKKYYWKVVPVNAYGEAADAPVWSFTTMADQSIKDFPYSEGFEEIDGQMPLGWSINAQGSTTWKISKISPYDGKQVAFAQGNTSGTEATLVSPEIVLPADECTVSFFWGNNPPASLSKDVTGSASNTTVAEDGIEAGYFEISDGGEFKTLAMISEDSQYWVRQAISLKDYAGKTVQLRWRYVLTKANQRRGLSLDNLAIQSAKDASLVYFNLSEWDGGKVNNMASWDSSDKLYIINGSTEAVTVKSVSFSDDAFSADIKAGDQIKATSTRAFKVTYSAGSVARSVSADMTVEFTNGVSVKLPVSAETLAADVKYYSFEGDEFGSIQPNGLTTIDVDLQPTVMSSVIKWPHRGEAFAYIVIDVTSDKADWRNVYPNSGDKVLAAFRTQTENVDAEDWIVSPKLTATSQSKFRFFGKSYATTDDYNDFTPHYFEVWVSTTDPTVSAMTERAKAKTELAYREDQKFTEYSIDLSKWAGKQIYVGLKHTTTISGYVAFFDDFFYEHFDSADGVSDINIDSQDGEATYYNLQGVKLNREDLAPGVYIRRQGAKAQKIVIK